MPLLTNLHRYDIVATLIFELGYNIVADNQCRLLTIESENKWVTLIQNASLSNRKFTSEETNN